MVLKQNSFMTLGEVANHFAIEPWKVRAMFERGFLPQPSRMGIFRVIARADLGKIETALFHAGYLPIRGGRRRVAVGA